MVEETERQASVHVQVKRAEAGNMAWIVVPLAPVARAQVRQY